jgi:16S rRNA (adenine1518-N6/adenine1519-N6)-dimethyltransferase
LKIGRMKARKRFGQHFLEPVWARKLVEAIQPAPTDTFLEIGPGRGALTRPLAESGARIVAVEIDRDLAAGLAADAPPNVTLVTGDFLELDVLPILLGLMPQEPARQAALRSAGPRAPAAGPGARVRVVGNLPYNVSSPILFRLLELQHERELFVDATLMLQQEVADRIAAPPGSRASGALSIFLQIEADVTRLLSLPPGAFRPAPKVRSAVLRLVFRPPAVSIRDTALFQAMVRRLFMGRRKTALNALRPFAATLGASAEAALAAAGIRPIRRPETLQLTELARLAEFFSSARRPSVL